MSIASPHFLNWGNIGTTIVSMSTAVLIIIGMTVVMASGGIDLSVGSNMAISGAVTGFLFVDIGGMNIWVAALFGVLAAGVIGLINGLILSKTNIAPMICTLGTMNLSAGIAMILTTGSPISMKDTTAAFKAIGRGSIGPISNLIIIAIVFIIIFAILLEKSTVFRKAYYVGSNEQAAEYSSINVARTKLGIYILSGLLAGLAGIMTTSRFSVASPNAGLGVEMTAISACVIGGASMNGGTGTVIGSLLGLMLLTFINNALVLLNVDVYWQNMISGVILLLAVLIDYISHRKRK
jgi:ribose transport system permease protein